MNEIQKLIESFGCKLYDTEVERGEGTIYRVLVYKEDGVSLDLLAEVTRALSPMLDVKPPINGAYYLEVSSPGVERKLKTLEHYNYALNQNIKVQIGSKKHKGKLLSATSEKIELETKNGVELFNIADIISAKTVFDWKEDLKTKNIKDETEAE